MAEARMKSSPEDRQQRYIHVLLICSPNLKFLKRSDGLSLKSAELN